MEVICVYAESDYGFVGTDQKGFKCSTCNFNQHGCSHIKFIEDKIKQDDADLPEFVYEMFQFAQKKQKDEWRPCCVSKKPIQFRPPLHIQEVLRGSLYESLCQEDDGSLIVVPCSSGVCTSCGSSWSKKNPVQEAWKDERLLLYTMNKVYSCTSMCTHMTLD